MMVNKTNYNLYGLFGIMALIGLVGSIAAIQAMDRYERDLLIEEKKQLNQELQDLVNEFKQTHQADYFYNKCVAYEQVNINSFDRCMNDYFPGLVEKINKINEEINKKQSLINDLG